MQITVPCHRCEQPKRPLSLCPSCAAAPLTEPELQAWRVSLHAHHMARITASPNVADRPAPSPRRLEPRQVIVTLPEEDELERHPAPIVPVGPAVQPDDALSFDWEDEGNLLGRLRRSA